MSKPVLSSLDFGGAARIQNLPDAVASQEPATLAQLNAAVEGLAWKDSCRVATQSNVNLAAPGASVDGITLTTGDRVLVRSQTAGAENGVYIWNGSAVPATRSPDTSTAAELEQAITTIEEGTSAGATFRQTVVNLTLGTTTVTWATFGTAAPSASETVAGVGEIATQAETNTGTDDARFVTPLKLAAYTGHMRRFAQTFGDGSATQFDITHNLGTVDVQVEIVRVSDGVTVWCDIQRISTTVVRLNFAAAPSINQYRAVILG